MILPLIVLAAAAALMSVYVAYPPPPLSQNLLQWQGKGVYLMWKGMKIFYIDVPGTGPGGSVICLHGFPTSSYDWIKILPSLQKTFGRVVMFDFLGYGFSSKPTNITYTIGEQADITEGLATQLGILSSHILSHDYGDTVALELLHRHNNGQLSFEMLSLSMLNGGIFPDTHHPRPTQKLLLTPVLGFAASYLFNFKLFSRGLGKVFGANQPSQEDFEDFWAALRYNNGDRACYKIINFLRERQHFKERWVGALKSAKVKVLMIYGPADPVNPLAFAEHFRKVVPAHKLVTLDPNISHYPQWEDPDSVGRAVEEFIQGLP